MDEERESSPPPRVLIPIPRPALWPVLPALAIADVVTSFTLAVIVPLAHNHAHPIEVALLVCAVARCSVVAGVGSSRRIRGYGWAVAGTGIVSLLVLLSRLNALLLSHHTASIDVDTVALLASSLSFPALHWIAFLACVGVTLHRNPFAGPTLGLARGRADRERWMEESVEVERVGVLDDEDDTLLTEGQVIIDDDDGSDSDPDDIQDLPPPTPSVLTPVKATDLARRRRLSERSAASVNRQRVT